MRWTAAAPLGAALLHYMFSLTTSIAPLFCHTGHMPRSQPAGFSRSPLPSAPATFTVPSLPLQLSESGIGTLAISASNHTTVPDLETCSSVVFMLRNASRYSPTDSYKYSDDITTERKVQLRHANASVLLAYEADFPSGWYCVQLMCGCLGNICQPYPTKCNQPHQLPGVNMDAWSMEFDCYRLIDSQEESSEATAKAAAAAAADHSLQIKLVFHQSGYTFPLRVTYNACVNGERVTASLRAREPLLMHTRCQLAFGKNISVEVCPDTWFCANAGTVLCKCFSHVLPAQQPLQLVSDANSLRGAALFGIVAAALLIWAAAITAAVLYRRARVIKRSSSPKMVPPEPLGGRCSVLLLHLTATDAERAAVADLTEVLGRAGAQVVNNCEPAACDIIEDRVCVLVTPAAVAAMKVDAGGSREQLQFSAAVRSLVSGSSVSNGRRLVCQAGLGASQTPHLAGLSPGVFFTLPEHKERLVQTLTSPLAAGGHDVY